MENKPLRIIYTVVKWVTLTMIILTLSVIAVKCLDFYFIKNISYSREAVVIAFTEISPLVYLCFAFIICGSIISIFIPVQKHKPAVNEAYVLSAYKNKYVLYSLQTKNEEKKRVIFKTVFVVSAVIAFVFPLLYLLDKENFTVEKLNSDIVAAVIAVMIPTAIVFVLLFLCVILCAKSQKREAEIYKNAVKSGEAIKTENKQITKRSYVNYLRALLISTAVILIILGIFNDGIGDVYGKAVRICTECIGLG